MENSKKLRRSRKSRMIAGVCGGVADFLGLSAATMRIIFILVAIFGGVGLLLYLAMWVIVPQESLTDR